MPSINAKDKVEEALGPWRFAADTTEPLEDNFFEFKSENLSVPKRRKHFSKTTNLTGFTYDPDVVYSASFFTPFCDFNTFQLALGPVHMNISSYFETMPVRYTLRSSRLVPGTKDEEVFCTISFQLVDV